MNCEARMFARRSHPRSSTLLTLSVMLLSMFLAGAIGCVEYRVVKSGWDKYPQDPKPSNTDTRVAGDNWTVLVHQFTGPQRHEYARDMRRRLQRETNLTDLWLHEAHGTVGVYRGRYTDRREAHTALQQVRQTTLAGRKPFRSADLVPLQQRAEVSDDPRDAERYPGQYTLQIGYFDQSFRGDRREAAEKIVNTLREQGHQAYYYHGERHSLVTLGIFTYQEAFVSRPDPRLPSVMIDTYAPHIHELQELFPYNLGNATDLPKAQKNKHPDAQPSMMMRIY